MPDLGKYAATVIFSYVGTILPMAVLVALTLWRGSKVKQALKRQEERMKKNG
ncbi:heme exporter protein CcmD [Sinorhodobacter sp. B57]|nr:heme exporter protein CcmD [Sedimentimonas flavescens]